MNEMLGKAVMVMKEDVNFDATKEMIGKIGVVLKEESSNFYGDNYATVDFNTNNFKGGNRLWGSPKTCYGIASKCLKVLY